MKKLLPLWIFLTVAVLSGTSQGQTNPWTASSGADTLVAKSFCSQGGTIYVGTAGDSVYASTDNGKTWTQPGCTGLYSHVYAVTSSGSNLIAGTDLHGIYYSTDGGATWTTSDLTNIVINSFAVGGGNVYAGSNSGVYLSTDNGQTWVQATNNGLTNGTVYSLAYLTNGTSGDTLYAGTGAGVFYSTDDGADWTAGSGFASSTSVYSLALGTGVIFAGGHNGTTGQSLYKSTDAGATWSLVTSLSAQNNITALLYYNNVLYAGNYAYGVYASPDNGASWYTNNSGLPSGPDVQCLFSDGTNLLTGLSGAAGSGNQGVYYVPISDVSLDVQVSSFTANPVWNGIRLSWDVQSQVNNAGFDVYRKDPGATQYRLIASYLSNDSLKGLGTATSPSIYNFTDTKVQAGNTYQYMIKSVSTSGQAFQLNTISATAKVPNSYALFQNFPNPFNPSTNIRFDLKQESSVILDIYNVLGQKIMEKNYGEMKTGSYEKSINMARFSSGVYFYMIKVVGQNSEEFHSVKKMVLLK